MLWNVSLDKKISFYTSTFGTVLVEDLYIKYKSSGFVVPRQYFWLLFLLPKVELLYFCTALQVIARNMYTKFGVIWTYVDNVTMWARKVGRRLRKAIPICRLASRHKNDDKQRSLTIARLTQKATIKYFSDWCKAYAYFMQWRIDWYKAYAYFMS